MALFRGPLAEGSLSGRPFGLRPQTSEYVIDKHSCRSREDDQQDGVHLAPRPDEDPAEEHPAPGVDEVLLVGGVAVWEDQQQGRRSDHADDGRAHAAHGPLDQPVVLQAHEEARHEDHERQRRKTHGEGGDHRPEDPEPFASGLDAHRISDVGRRVDGDGPGCDLRDGHDVGELGVREPLVLHDHLVLDEREHGVTSSESEESDLEVRDEELPE